MNKGEILRLLKCLNFHTKLAKISTSYLRDWYDMSFYLRETKSKQLEDFYKICMAIPSSWTF